MGNLEEMDKLEKYSFPRLNQEELRSMNRPITSNEIETDFFFFFDAAIVNPIYSRKREWGGGS